MKKLTTILVVLTVFIVCSCSNTNSMYRVPADYAVEESALQVNEQKLDEIETVERKIIKQGHIKFITADVNKTKSFITQIVNELNGYVAKDNAYDYSDRLEHKLTIRVPAKNFDVLLNNISESVEKLESKNIDIYDVTEEYIDIDVRIQTKKDLQKKYTELLSRATKVEEILNIEKEIGNLQTEIESIEGRMKYLKDNIAFSTLTVTYYQKATNSFGFISKFVEGVKKGWSFFLWVIVGLSYLWVFLLSAAFTIYIIKLLKKKKTP